MPRPRKCRKVCCLPDNDGFVPVRGGEELTPIVLNVDEYEAIRLIDREGFSQEQCGEYMRIARTTVQQIYAAARKKLADALVEGLPLRIEGGDFTLRNKGVTYVNGKGRGDQYVRVSIEVPTNLTGKQKDMLREFEASTGDKNYAKRKSFFDKIKDAFKGD